jgi:hypothetical protein
MTFYIIIKRHHDFLISYIFVKKLMTNIFSVIVQNIILKFILKFITNIVIL